MAANFIRVSNFRSFDIRRYIGLYNSKECAFNVSFVALGSLAYAAINSSGWVLAEKERIAYGIPMWVSLTGSIVLFVILIK